MANQVVYGIIGDRTKAEQLVQALVNLGISSEDISFLSSHREEFQDFSSEYITNGTNRNWRTEERITDYPSGTTYTEEQILATDHPIHNQGQTKHEQGKGGLGHEKHTKAPEGATTGAATGGLIGGTLGLLAGIGALAIPGLGPFIAAGPLLATLGGIGAGGTIGGLIGALVGSGIPEYEAKRYENRLKEGGILLAARINSDTLAKQAKDLFKQYEAEDISISSEASISKNYKK